MPTLQHLRISLTYGVVICTFALTAPAQQPRVPQMPAPPPMRFVSRDERSRLDSTKDPKARLRATITLAEGHLTEAEGFTTQRKYDHASEELGSYLGLIDDGRDFAGSFNRDKSSTRDLFRHLDIALRAHIPRLAVMRRSTPAEYAGHIKAAEEYIRDVRAAALDSFYGHTVLREDTNNEKKPILPPEENKRP